MTYILQSIICCLDAKTTKPQHGKSYQSWNLDSEDKNIELNPRDNEGYTQFMIACEFGQKDVVQLLLDHLEDIHIDLKFKKQNRRHCIYDFLRPWT